MSMLKEVNSSYSVAIIGANGRMGKEVEKVIQKESPKLTTKSLIDQDDNISTALESDIIIDFSHYSATAKLVQIAIDKKYKGIVVICTTAIEEDIMDNIKTLSKTARVSVISNSSLGIIIMREIAKKITRSLPESDIEIIETHHRHKIDSPSGTSLSLGKAIGEVRDVKLQEVAVYGRKGIQKRQDREIGFSVIRGGEAYGEHSIKFFFGSEMLELSHTSFNRSIHADGAIKIAMLLTERSEPCFFNDENIDQLISNGNTIG